MKFNSTGFQDLYVIEPKIFSDHRGIFYESFNDKIFKKETGLAVSFVQDNHSISYKGVIRGLHLQKGDYAQAKLIRVISGKILDVVVDIRPESATFGEYYRIELSSDNYRQLFIPRGFAHGFVVLSDKAELTYKADNFYSPEHEGGIIYNDPDLRIDWGISDDEVKVSEKDKKLLPFSEQVF